MYAAPQLARYNHVSIYTSISTAYYRSIFSGGSIHSSGFYTGIQRWWLWESYNRALQGDTLIKAASRVGLVHDQSMVTEEEPES